ncbi:ABC transporter ATP-binding protein [Labrys monachus]|uniref:Multiple sugar transport system ATP-binding protein n=1 Tax=Labrys monachus TaxID=217067 RepID=A0ABU0FA08_9HYPH|nr:ABC transporter ATP-binding protein [Labrys monachus]MDQ0391430.1 multiple sugar transport system ATP-binding protein [Labrys monachus]
MASVTLRAVSKHWGAFTAVEAVSLDIADGEFMVLLGPSGCGKTTTMRMIAGLDDPTAGEILIGDGVVNDVSPGDRNLAMVFQNYGLYPHMTVAENIGYPLKVRRVASAERERKVRAAAARVELEAYLERKPQALSGGQRQRVALARAIVRTPRLFLMDEPLSNLDAKLRVSMRAQLKHLQRELGTTTIYVTHDQVEAMTLADRVAVMSKGRLQQVGSPLEIYNRPKNVMVAEFLGNPSMNLIAAAIEAGQIRHPSFSLAIGDLAPGPVTVGQRAEDMRIVPPDQGDFRAEIFAAELLGDATIMTVRLGSSLVAVKADKDCPARMGDIVGVTFDRSKLHFFDAGTGERLGEGARAAVTTAIDRAEAGS